MTASPDRELQAAAARLRRRYGSLRAAGAACGVSAQTLMRAGSGGHPTLQTRRRILTAAGRQAEKPAGPGGAVAVRAAAGSLPGPGPSEGDLADLVAVARRLTRSEVRGLIDMAESWTPEWWDRTLAELEASSAGLLR